MSACCSSVSCCFLSHWFEASAHAVPQSPAAAFHSSKPQLMLFLLLPFTLVRSLSICCSSVSCCCLSHWFEASAHAVPQSPAAAFHTGSKPQLMLFLSLLLLSFTLVRSLSSCCSSVSCCCLSHWFEASAHAVPQSPPAVFHTGSKPQLMLFLSLLLLPFTLVRSLSSCCSSVSCCCLSHWFEASAHAVPQSPAAAFHTGSKPQLMLFLSLLLLPFTLVRSLSSCCSSVSCCCLSHWFEASAHAVPQSPAAAFHTGSKPQLMLFLSLLLLSFTLVRSLSSCCSSVSSCCLSHWFEASAHAVPQSPPAVFHTGSKPQLMLFLSLLLSFTEAVGPCCSSVHRYTWNRIGNCPRTP